MLINYQCHKINIVFKQNLIFIPSTVLEKKMSMDSFPIFVTDNFEVNVQNFIP